MQYLTSVHQHMVAIYRACSQLPGVSVNVSLNDFRMEVTQGGKTTTWRPRFPAQINGRQCYVDRPHGDGIGFAGWLPYELRQWPASTDKMVFKQAATEAGVRLPAACTDTSTIGGPFLIKKSRSSFGEGIRGPYLAYSSEDSEQRLMPGEFYENFILGHIVKAWYWGEQWVAVEFHEPPFVTGDGRSTVRDLVAVLPPNPRRVPNWELLTGLARFCGLPGVDDVVPAGKQVLVDFKYASPYAPPARENLNIIDRVRNGPLGPQFIEAGKRIALLIAPHHPPDSTLYALDAMVDRDGAVWFLEMNSNPMVHPDAYLPMLRASASIPDD